MIFREKEGSDLLSTFLQKAPVGHAVGPVHACPAPVSFNQRQNFIQLDENEEGNYIGRIVIVSLVDCPSVVAFVWDALSVPKPFPPAETRGTQA